MSRTPPPGLLQPLKILCSYAYFHDRHMDKLINGLSVQDVMLFGDSGAHSARTLGLHLTLDAYATWCRKWEKQLTLYANLDVIGAPEATRRNQLELESRGLHPIPVFHTGEPWRYLEQYIEDGHTYIALGKLLGNPVDVVLPWIEKAFKIADGRAVFHGFGMTVWRALRHFPFYSVDSSTWTSGFRWGTVQLFNQGRWISVSLRDRAAILKNRDLIRAHGGDPLAFASRQTYDRPQVVTVAAMAWRRAEEYLRARHGPIPLPDGPHNPITRRGRAAYESAPGMHLYLAEAGSTRIKDAATGLTAIRDAEPGLHVYMANSESINHHDAINGVKAIRDATPGLHVYMANGADHIFYDAGGGLHSARAAHGPHLYLADSEKKNLNEAAAGLDQHRTTQGTPT